MKIVRLEFMNRWQVQAICVPMQRQSMLQHHFKHCIQELQSQVLHLSTMLTKVMQFIDEHLTNSNGLNVNPPYMPPQADPAHVPQHSRAVVPPPPPPPWVSESNSSVSRLPPPLPRRHGYISNLGRQCAVPGTCRCLRLLGDLRHIVQTKS